MKKHKKHRPIDEPAGYKRDDALRKAKDALDEAGEKLAEAEDKIALDPAKLKPIREILRYVQPTGDINIENADPNYVYKLVRHETRSGSAGSTQLGQALGEMVKTASGRTYAVWEEVKLPMKEWCGKRDAEGYWRIGDTVLLRCRKDVYLAVEAWKERQRKIAAGAVTSDLEAFAHEERRNVIFHGDPDDPVIQRLLSTGAAQRDFEARGRVNRNLREGTVPGASAAEMFGR